MPKKISLLAAASILIFSPYAFAESEEELEARCKQYAAEDQVTADEMESYLIRCIEDLSEETSKEEE